MQANKTQVAGSHYNGSGYQHWDFVADTLMGLYMEGQISKYVTRWRKKNGLQDLKKAVHFTEKLIELTDIGGNTMHEVQVISEPTIVFNVSRLGEGNDLTMQERAVCYRLATWKSTTDLRDVIGIINDMMLEHPEQS